MDRDRLIDEILMLLPVWGRGLERLGPGELGETADRGFPMDAHISPSHVQVLIALGRGPYSIRQLAGVVGVSSPAAIQLVNHLEEHKMVQRRHDPSDRMVILVEYAPGMHDIARRMLEGRKRRLWEAVNPMTDEETRAFLKGLRLLAESFDAAKEEPDIGPHR